MKSLITAVKYDKKKMLHSASQYGKNYSVKKNINVYSFL